VGGLYKRKLSLYKGDNRSLAWEILYVKERFGDLLIDEPVWQECFVVASVSDKPERDSFETSAPSFAGSWRIAHAWDDTNPNILDA